MIFYKITAYYHNDHLGTPQKMTDGSGAVVWQGEFKPFGEATITVSTITNNLRFPGQYFDAERGLNYNYFRDYNSIIGRYIQADPLGLFAGANLYAYVGNKPITWIDPEGDQQRRPGAVHDLGVGGGGGGGGGGGRIPNEFTPTTNRGGFKPIRGCSAKENKETGEIWELDKLHKDHYEVYRNRHAWENGVRDRAVWTDGRLRMEF